MPNELKEKTFTLELPEDFRISRDGAELQCLSEDPPGVLRLTPQKVEDKSQLPNLSRMLAGFLTRTGHPVATDELLRITSVPQAHGFSWQYVEDGKYHRFWLFGNEASWLLMTFVCPEPQARVFHERLQRAVRTLRLR